MKLTITATVTDGDATIASEHLEFIGNKSGIIHAVKPMGHALIYSIELGLFYKGKVPLKNALGETRTIAKDVTELTDKP